MGDFSQSFQLSSDFMKIAASLLIASSTAYQGDGKCQPGGLWWAAEQCANEDACCSDQQLCTKYCAEEDFYAHFAEQNRFLDCYQPAWVDFLPKECREDQNSE